MLRFALKNMLTKKIQILLVALSIIISSSIAVLAFNVSNQVSEGIIQNSKTYSLIIGPQGSKTQLAMNSIYFADDVLGSLPYSFVEELNADTRTKSVVPFAMADSYNGSVVVGTSSEYLNGYTLKSGEVFKDFSQYTAVVGYNVAKRNGLKVGSIINTSHSASHAHEFSGEAKGITVVGILNQTHSSFDNAVFTHISTLWALHGIGEHEEEAQASTGIQALSDVKLSEESIPEHNHDQSGGVENGGLEDSKDENHVHEKTVCAILISTKDLTSASQLMTEYSGFLTRNGKSYALQAINPDETIRAVLDDTNDTQAIVFVLCAVILIMNIMIITIITLLNMYHSTKEISLMRLIGISAGKINILYIIQNAIIGFVSVALAFGVSRICLLFMNDFVSSWGIVINMKSVNIVEILILLGVFIISIVPTAICTAIMSKKDSLGG